MGTKAFAQDFGEFFTHFIKGRLSILFFLASQANAAIVRHDHPVSEQILDHIDVVITGNVMRRINGLKLQVRKGHTNECLLCLKSQALVHHEQQWSHQRGAE